MTTLYIDTRNNQEIVIRIDRDGRIYEEKSVANKNKSQAALPMIERVLKEVDISLKDLNEIKVEADSGSFTGLRVGVAIANALSFAGLVTVNGKPLGEIVEPTY